LPDSEKTGKKNRLRRIFRSSRGEKEGTASHGDRSRDDENDIEVDKDDQAHLLTLRDSKEATAIDPESNEVQKRNRLVTFAYVHFASKLPVFPGFKEAYHQAGIAMAYESYLSTAFFVSLATMIPAFALSLFVELKFLHLFYVLAILGSAILSSTIFAISLLVWLISPLERRRRFKKELETQLAYSFGILGILSAAGLSVERMFEKIASLKSNPVMADLARRFVRNVKIFGLDTESALREVAQHSPSAAFGKMLESMAVAFRTTGSLKDLVMFESARLFAEKRDYLKKSITDLSLIAEMYITLVVVGPIIFVVLLSVLGFLPTPGLSNLPPIFLLINIVVFVGIPTISAVFLILLDSMSRKI
jgi:Type II secretion system (T2SS), protein F